MKHIQIGALIIATLFPAALACANPADENQSSETDQTALDETSYEGQVNLISSIFEDLQTVVEINAESLSPEKSDKVMAEVRSKLVDILKRLPAYHEMQEGTLKHLEQKDLQNSADGLLFPLSDLVAALPKTETNSTLLLSVKSKIELLRKGF